LKEASLKSRGLLVSADIFSFFTNVPVEETLHVINSKLLKVPSLPLKTTM
jgi:hypothetical protein